MSDSVTPPIPPPPPNSPMPPQGQPVAAGKPDNYLVWSILALIFCCWPFGIVAVVKAAKVDGLWNSGHYDEAVAASEDAKKWTIITAIIGVVLGVLWLLFYGFALIAGNGVNN